MSVDEPSAEEQRARIQDRLRIVEAIATAVDRRAELFEIIERAADADEARNRIRTGFGVDDVQALAMLDLQTRRFASRERQRIVDERDELRRGLVELDR